MKFNAVVTNIDQSDPSTGGFTDAEKAQGRKNIAAGGLAKYEIDAVEQWSGDLVLGQRTGSSMREIGVKLRDAVSGDYKVGYLVPPRTFKGMNLVCDESGNITWGVQPPQLKSGNYTWIDDHYHINVSGLQEHLTFEYTEDQKISGINGSAINGAEPIIYSAGDYVFINSANVINVTGLQPSGDYALATDLSAYATHEEVISATSGKLDISAYTAPVQSDWNQNDDTALDYIKNKPTIPSLEGYATEEYVNSATSGKLDTSAYHEYSAGQYLSLNDYVFNVTGVQPELNFDYTEAGKISAINGSAVYGSEGGATYTEGQYIEITDQNQINVTGTSALIAGQNISISATNSGYMISSTGGSGGETYYAGDYVYIDPANQINVTGLQPSGNYQPSGDYALNSDLSAYATKVYVNSAVSGKLDTSAYEAPVQSDWTEDDNTLQSYILHKPVEIGLIAGSGVWFEDMTSAVKINCSATGLDYAVSGISGVSGIFIEDAGDHMNIGYSGSVGGAGGTSGYYTDLGGTTYFEDDFTFTHDGHFSMGSMEKAMVPVSNLVTDEGKVPVIYVRDGRSYYLLERIIPSYTSATNGKILGVQNNALAWVNNPVKIVADSADIPASGSSDNILYVVAAD